MSIVKAVFIKPGANYNLFVRFADGKEGAVDLSSVAGKGVFEIWETPGVFEKAYIDATGAVAWNEQVDICSDALYELLNIKTDAKDK